MNFSSNSCDCENFSIVLEFFHDLRDQFHPFIDCGIFFLHFEEAVISRFFSYARPTVHAASRHGTPSLTSLPKDGAE